MTTEQLENQVIRAEKSLRAAIEETDRWKQRMEAPDSYLVRGSERSQQQLNRAVEIAEASFIEAKRQLFWQRRREATTQEMAAAEAAEEARRYTELGQNATAAQKYRLFQALAYDRWNLLPQDIRG